jgi:hypothetical protein
VTGIKGQFFVQGWLRMTATVTRGGEPAAIIRQVRAAWDDLGSEPDLGDVVWFAAPGR